MKARVRTSLLALLPVLAALASGPAMAAQNGDAPRAGAKAKPEKVAQAEPAPLNPRWVPPKWEIKGLVVWVFTPGHFERD
ncbi:hypothetical protein [Xanthobacter sp. VNH20]|uniref:hypothetical protein n=1 Tax=Xanthobacter sp. VNH20 TaxID=3156616 RepID=UPI0032B61CD8